MQKWLDDNAILMYFTHNEGKSIEVKSIKKQQLLIKDLILVI